MIAKCRANTGRSLPSASRDPKRGLTATTEFPLTIGRSYPVYAVTVFLGITWFYVLDDDELSWPIWMPALLFDVTDGSLPDTWEFGHFRHADGGETPILSFPEWASDLHYYERLVDGDPDATATFERRRSEVET